MSRKKARGRRKGHAPRRPVSRDLVEKGESRLTVAAAWLMLAASALSFLTALLVQMH
jgi:hypothetical protein